MYSSVRVDRSAGQGAWAAPVQTNIPNDESNLNTGTLPDGRIFLLNNAVLEPKNTSNKNITTTAAGATTNNNNNADAASGQNNNTNVAAGLGHLRFRDPVTIALSKDGYVFDKAYAVMTCTNLTNGAGPSTCTPRHTETPTSWGGKNPGPSYPQGLAVMAPAPEELHGLYVVATNNKEDVWLTKLDYTAL